MSTATAERTGPLHRHENGGHLWYIHPHTQERFLSVTSALDFISKKYLDNYWRPGLAAKAAFEELPRLVAASMLRPCGRTKNRCGHHYKETCPQCPCRNCEDCLVQWMTTRHMAESKRAADRGSRVHHWVDGWVTTGGLRADVDDEMQPYVDQFLQFTTDYGLVPTSWEVTETTILNRTHMWGGTLDGRVRFDARASVKAYDLCSKFGLAAPLLTVDLKSREGNPDDGPTKPLIVPEHAKQQSAYRRGETVLLDDGSEYPLEPDDGAIIVQLRPDGYTVRPVVTDDATYAAFLANLASARWEIELASESTLVRSFPPLPIPGVPDPRVKPAKTAAATRPSRVRVPAHAADTAPPLGDDVDGLVVPMFDPKRKPAAPKPAATTARSRSTAEALGIRRSDPLPSGQQLTDSDIPF